MSIADSIVEFTQLMNDSGIAVVHTTTTYASTATLVRIVLRLPSVDSPAPEELLRMARIVDHCRSHFVLYCSRAGVPMEKLCLYVDAVSPFNIVNTRMSGHKILFL